MTVTLDHEALDKENILGDLLKTWEKENGSLPPDATIMHTWNAHQMHVNRGLITGA